jgi:hypothetical protein
MNVSVAEVLAGVVLPQASVNVQFHVAVLKPHASMVIVGKTPVGATPTIPPHEEPSVPVGADGFAGTGPPQAHGATPPGFVSSVGAVMSPIWL